jgi:histidine ammonia-lyase
MRTQLHGASTTLASPQRSDRRQEINSVTDNPIILDENHTISGKNRLGQPIALPHYACLAASEVWKCADPKVFLTGDTWCP